MAAERRPTRKASGIFSCVHHPMQEINSLLMQHDSFSFPSVSFFTPPIRPSSSITAPRSRSLRTTARWVHRLFLPP